MSSFFSEAGDIYPRFRFHWKWGERVNSSKHQVKLKLTTKPAELKKKLYLVEMRDEKDKLKEPKRQKQKMIRCEMIIYWSKEDQSYLVEVLELPGCMADRQTYEETVKNAAQIIEEWIKTAKELGREIPQPKGKLMYA